jgi:hypothetical protein
MSVREQQRPEPFASPVRPPGAEDKSFTEVLAESLHAHESGEAGESVSATAEMDERCRFGALLDGSAVARAREPVVSLQRVRQGYAQGFEDEQQLVLAAQRTPASRYRIHPDEDTSGDTETAANLQPIR